MVDIRVTRRWFNPHNTLGLMDYGNLVLFTLEDVVRKPGEKIPGKTAIPPGEYPLVITPSKRFGKDLPEIQMVPGWSGVRIHSGNDEDDTSGCILIGMERDGDKICYSRIAMELFMERLKKETEPVMIHISQPLTIL